MPTNPDSRWRRHGWLLFLAAAVVPAVVAHRLGTAGGPIWLLIQGIGIVLSCAAVLPRADLAASRARSGWWLLIGSRVVGVLGNAWWILRMAFGGAAPPATLLGLAGTAQYILYGVAVLRLTRRRRSAGAVESGLEAAGVVLGVGMLAWSFVVQPYLRKPGYHEVGGGLALLYGVLDLVILALVLRSLFTRPAGPARLLAASGASVLAGHLIYAAMGGAGPNGFLPGGVGDLTIQISGLLLTAAALHPAATGLGAAPAPAESTLSPAKLTAILLTGVLSPGLPTLAALLGGRRIGSTEIVPAALISTLCGVLIGRIWLLARIGERRAAALRQALLEQRDLQDRLAYRAGHDTLTGLANRDLFLERLGLLGVPAGSLALCGLDGFKGINDTYGHTVGDEVLIRLAERLAGCLAPGDLLARLGGDEFGVLLGARDPRAVCEALVRAVAEPVEVGDRRLHLTLSVGVADAGPDALGDADLALQAAKRDGRARVTRYDAGLRAEQAEKTRIGAGLRQALADGGLSMNYQPVVDPRTGVTTGVEALMRWDRAGPTQFIPIAEQTGLIGALGEFALRSACREARRWYDRYGIYVTVNVSGHQLRDPGFTDLVLDVLAESGLPAAALVLEITESVLIDTDDAMLHLRALRVHGVRIAIDDFGTGYSSLAYLHTLPIDILKIDQAFVSRHDDPRGIGFLRAILQIASSQGLIAVAEGVETEGQAVLLRDIGCPLVQGYYFGRPAVPADIDLRLARAATARTPAGSVQI